jgi:hypothetical protein
LPWNRARRTDLARVLLVAGRTAEARIELKTALTVLGDLDGSQAAGIRDLLGTLDSRE